MTLVLNTYVKYGVPLIENLIGKKPPPWLEDRSQLEDFKRVTPEPSKTDEFPKSKESEIENDKIEPSDKIEDAKLRMNELLKSLAQIPDTAISKISLAHPTPRRKQEMRIESIEKDPYVDAKLTLAVKEVAKEIGGDEKATQSELFASLKSHSKEKSLSELLSSMTIDHTESSLEKTEKIPRSRLHEYKKKTDWTRQKPKTIDLLSSEPLGILVPIKESKTTNLTTWNTLEERDRRIKATQPARNAFEEMIQWTEQGKLWTFPIDNEIGLEEEKKCTFADHIFLERHLEDWCPKKGPIRHFMELVCTGLSKNPHLTVARKKAHIEWYKNYFENKRTLLQELGAM